MIIKYFAYVASGESQKLFMKASLTLCTNFCVAKTYN